MTYFLAKDLYLTKKYPEKRGFYIVSKKDLTKLIIGARYEGLEEFSSFENIRINDGKNRVYIQMYERAKNQFAKVKLRWNWRTKGLERKLKKKRN